MPPLSCRAAQTGRPEGHLRPRNRYRQGSQGNIFISDGYGNSRFVKISPDGHWLKVVGTYGSGPDQFKTPHTIAVDANDNVYVGDRGNSRIQVYDDNMNFVRASPASAPPGPSASPTRPAIYV